MQLRKINTQWQFVSSRRGYKVFKEEKRDTVAAIYSPYKDTFERCGGLRSMELEGPERDRTKKDQGKKRERSEQRRQREGERDTTSGVKWHRLRRDASLLLDLCICSRCIFSVVESSLSNTVCAFIAEKCRHWRNKPNATVISKIIIQKLVIMPDIKNWVQKHVLSLSY